MKRQWTKGEDTILQELVSKHGKQWGLISAHIPDRSASQVAARWEKCLDPNLHKGPFTPDEDQLIVNYVAQNGPRSWPHVVSVLPHRSSKQCRERWFNHLDPSVVKTEWTPQEDDLIFQRFTQVGPKWSMIAKSFPGRSDNAIKNRWNSSISKRIVTDEAGNKKVAPDSSRRKYKVRDRVVLAQSAGGTPEKKTPPPLQIPVLGGSTEASPSLPFTPFTLPTPTFGAAGDLVVFSPGGALSGLQTPGAMFGGLGSPTKASPMLLSPTKPPNEETL